MKKAKVSRGPTRVALIYSSGNRRFTIVDVSNYHVNYKSGIHKTKENCIARSQQYLRDTDSRAVVVVHV